MECEYGCGQKAKYKLKNGKMCCRPSYNSCPAAKKKNSDGNKGKEITDETKEKIRNSNKGKKRSDETKEKIRIARLGSILLDETKEKISKKLKGTRCGDENPFYGKRHTQKSRMKMSESRKGQTPWNKGKKGSESPSWKGGYSSRNIPLYDTYNKKLLYTDKTRRNKNDKNILEVKCSLCKKYFIPTLISVINRIAAINGIQGGEHKFYCSDECKMTCPVYKKRIYQENFPKKINNINSEDYKVFRDYVLKRDNHTCQYCGKLAEHVHHERPQKLEPFFALDPDLAWSVCKECHYKYGHKDECSTGNLANMVCKG